MDEKLWEVAESKLWLGHGFLCGVTRAGSVIVILPLSISPFASQKTSFWHGSSCWCLLACLSRWGTHLPGSPHYAACSGAQWQRLSPWWKLPLPAPSLQNEHCRARPLHCGGAFLLLVPWWPEGAVLWSLCFTAVPFPRELAKAMVMGWVLYRYAVLWASAALGFSNVDKEASCAGSSLLQGSPLCMAMKCYFSWDSILLSGIVWTLIPAFWWAHLNPFLNPYYDSVWLDFCWTWNAGPLFPRVLFLPSFPSAVEQTITLMIPALGQSDHIKHRGNVQSNGAM